MLQAEQSDANTEEIIFDSLLLSEKAANNVLLYSVLAFDETWGGQIASLQEVLYQDTMYNELTIEYQQCIFNIINDNKDASLENKDRMINVGCKENLDAIYNYVLELADDIN
jgi:hypothetical protein